MRVKASRLSIDGYGAGPDQSLENPLGVGGHATARVDIPHPHVGAAHVRATTGGETGVDDDFAARSFENVGAWILGRNMFGPVRGPWPDESLARLVGRRPALPHAGVRPHAPPAPAARRCRAARRFTS